MLLVIVSPNNKTNRATVAFYWDLCLTDELYSSRESFTHPCFIHTPTQESIRLIVSRTNTVRLERPYRLTERPMTTVLPLTNFLFLEVEKEANDKIEENHYMVYSNQWSEVKLEMFMTLMSLNLYEQYVMYRGESLVFNHLDTIARFIDKDANNEYALCKLMDTTLVVVKRLHDNRLFRLTRLKAKLIERGLSSHGRT